MSDGNGQLVLSKAHNDQVGKLIWIHSEIEKHAQEAARLALQAGELLVTLKADTKHGEWAEVVKSLPYSHDTANWYMRCYNNLQALPKSERAKILKSETTVRGLDRAIKEATPKPEPAADPRGSEPEELPLSKPAREYVAEHAPSSEAVERLSEYDKRSQSSIVGQIGTDYESLEDALDIQVEAEVGATEYPTGLDDLRESVVSLVQATDELEPSPHREGVLDALQTVLAAVDRWKNGQPVTPLRHGFKPPSIAEIQAYCQKRKNQVDPDSFFDFYQSKGWKIGKEKMKDWQAAVRTWEKRGPKNGAALTGKY